MKRLLGKACWLLAAGLLGAGCKSGGQAGKSDAPAPAPAGWNKVYSVDFKDAAKAPAEWVALSGEIRVAGGALELKAEGGGDGQVYLKSPKCPGSVRVEAVACLVGDVCDLSPFINSDDSGYAAGYLLQFGGGGNSENRIRREGEVVDGSENTKMMVTAGKKYNLVVENDGGKVRLLVDGQELLAFTDKSPLKGAGHELIGFYTWGCTLKVEKLAVFTK